MKNAKYCAWVKRTLFIYHEKNSIPEIKEEFTIIKLYNTFEDVEADILNLQIPEFDDDIKSSGPDGIYISECILVDDEHEIKRNEYKQPIIVTDAWKYECRKIEKQFKDFFKDTVFNFYYWNREDVVFESEDKKYKIKYMGSYHQEIFPKLTIDDLLERTIHLEIVEEVLDDPHNKLEFKDITKEILN